MQACRKEWTHSWVQFSVAVRFIWWLSPYRAITIFIYIYSNNGSSIIHTNLTHIYRPAISISVQTVTSVKRCNKDRKRATSPFFYCMENFWHVSKSRKNRQRLNFIFISLSLSFSTAFAHISHTARMSG